jgi:hypothetical protein
MSNKSLSAGDSIEARCTKCRKNNPHTIVTLAETAPDKVECSVCNRQHKYRAPSPPPRRPTPRRTVDPHKDEKEAWAALRPDMNASKALRYSMDSAFKRGALIDHKVFGLGLVQRVVDVQKVEVLFEDGKKMMRCKQV